MSVDPNFWKGRSVLITGNTGFKGTWLAHWLTHLGAEVTGLSLPLDPSQAARAGSDVPAKTYFSDIRDMEAVRACVEAARPSVVFHMAAQSLVRPSYADPVGTYATNVMGTVHVLEAARKAAATEAVVVVTSDKCYENREWPWGYREYEAMGGYDPYSSSKGCAELVTSAYRRSFFAAPEAGPKACQIASGRAGNVIGGGDWSTDRLIPDVIRSLSEGASVEIRSPHAVRPWQHVLEPLSGYIQLAESLVSENGNSYAESWNFGPADEDCKPVSYLVRYLAKAWGEGAVWHLSASPQPHEANFLKVDSSKSRARLNWNRRMSLDQALDWTVEWYRRQRGGEKPERLTVEQIERYGQLGGLA